MPKDLPPKSGRATGGGGGGGAGRAIGGEGSAGFVAAYAGARLARWVAAPRRAACRSRAAEVVLQRWEAAARPLLQVTAASRLAQLEAAPGRALAIHGRQRLSSSAGKRLRTLYFR
jgi:hypothetical protein